MGQTPGASQATPTPASSSTQDAPPTGLIPNAKRPMNRYSVQVANTGSRLMSQEDLSAGFYNLASLQTRDEAFTKNVASCVDYNGKLLNELVTRVNTLEASRNLNTTKVDELTADVRSALGTVEKGDQERDKNLRAELPAMATRLEEGHAELQQKIAQLGSAAVAATPAGPPPAPPGMPPNNELLGRNLTQLQNVVEESNAKIGGMEKHAEPAVSRMGDLGISMKFHASGAQEMHGALSALRVEVEQLVPSST